MKKTLFFVFALLINVSLFASSTPASIEDGRNSISVEMADLDQIEQLVLTEGLTYDQLSEKFPSLVEDTNLAAAIEDDGILDSAPDSPLGIPGLAWGFVCGICGLLVIYLAMDEGADRKEQLKYGIYGCIASSILGAIYNFLIRST